MKFSKKQVTTPGYITSDEITTLELSFIEMHIMEKALTAYLRTYESHNHAHYMAAEKLSDELHVAYHAVPTEF